MVVIFVILSMVLTLSAPWPARTEESRREAARVVRGLGSWIWPCRLRFSFHRVLSLHIESAGLWCGSYCTKLCTSSVEQDHIISDSEQNINVTEGYVTLRLTLNSQTDTVKRASLISLASRISRCSSMEWVTKGHQRYCSWIGSRDSWPSSRGTWN